MAVREKNDKSNGMNFEEFDLNEASSDNLNK